eukprot:TRINITY_DN5829_c0_g1_i3.p1 TRINITY_DN5829_c0_g1~~TRINITY_DN5829_c0_g1_i3.p1  ORF type:complete len:253 (-),score=38.10 TRINITY_DN5829_c0_g1_i3:96-854(-)
MALRALRCSKCAGIWFEDGSPSSCKCEHDYSDRFYDEVLEFPAPAKSVEQAVFQTNNQNLFMSSDFFFHEEDQRLDTIITAGGPRDEWVDLNLAPTVNEEMAQPTDQAESHMNMQIESSTKESTRKTKSTTKRGKMNCQDVLALIDQICEKSDLIIKLKSICLEAGRAVMEVLESQSLVFESKTIAAAVVYLVANTKGFKIQWTAVINVVDVHLYTAKNFHKKMTTELSKLLANPLGKIDLDLKASFRKLTS